MLNHDDLVEMFIDYLDSTYEKYAIEDIAFFPSEILERFEGAWDKLFKEYIDKLDITWVQTGEDGYYKLNTLLDEEL